MAVPVPRGPGFGSGKHRRRTLVLAVAFVLYLAMGGGVFHLLETYSGPVTVERPVTAWQRVFDHLQSNDTGEERPGWPEVKQAAVTLCWEDSRPHVDELLESLHDSSSSSGSSSSSSSGDELAAGEWGDEGMVMVLYPPPEDAAVRDLLLLCGNRSYELLTEEQEVPWSFIDAVFFCMTVVTTIGYGHITPRTPGGQVFCIVYSLLGIPISGLLLAGLSDFFAGNLANFFDTKWAKRHGDSKWSLAAFTVLYLLVGFVLFVFVPAVVFMWLEDWTYLEAVYYAFITLSTVGFGDYTAAVSDDTGWMTVYKMVVMVWILVGLGYWVLVLNFLQKTLKSKEVLKTLKSTSRLIAKEADELRSALAEVGLIHRDATFIPEHSKMALSMMLSMSQTLAGTTGDGTGEGGTEPAAFVRGIHSIGDNMRHRGLLAALMASLPPPPPPASGAVPPGEAEGRVNEGYLSDDNTEEVSSPTSSSSRRQQTETEIETELDTELDAELELETDGAGAAAVMVLAALDCGQAEAPADTAAVRDCPV